MSTQYKICILIPYFGTWPHWFPYFLLSCKHNPSVDWYLFSDCGVLPLQSKNLFLVRMTLEEFNSLASQKLQMYIKVKHPYKLCDFKPAYAKIFEDFIKDYNFWGYGDIDLIYGKISNFLNTEIFNNYDIISPHESFIPGHFCLVRNNKKINSLFLNCSNWKQVFQSQKCHCFDERLYPPGLEISEQRIKKFIHRRVYRHLILKRFLQKKFVSMVLQNIPNRKQKSKDNLLDFNSVVTFYSKKGELKLWQKFIYCDDVIKKFKGEKQFTLTWNEGRLYDGHNELLYYHFQLAKYSNKMLFESTSKTSFIISFD